MGHFCANVRIDLRGSITLAVNPVIHVPVEPWLHQVGHSDLEVVTQDHSLQHKRYGNRVPGGVGIHESFISSLYVIRSASGKDPVNLDIVRPLTERVVVLDEVFNRHGGRTSLAVAHQINGFLLGLHAHGFEPRPDREVHVQHVMGCDVHDQVRVNLVGCHSVPQIIGDDKSVALADKNTLQRETVTRRFGVGTDRIMADEEHTFGFASLG